MKAIYSIAILILSTLSGCISQQDTTMIPPSVVDSVDLKKYTGEWYEIARYPNRFQKDCEGSKATYSLRDDGKLTVLNECYDKTYSTLIRSVKGRAWVVDKETNAKLKVSFFWPFSGDYWIIDLGKEYDYAVIGHPKRKYLWILSRTPQIEEKLYQQILAGITKQKYDISKLIPHRKTGE
jgi:apolipoprotein D and lipocalin family protein